MTEVTGAPAPPSERRLPRAVQTELAPSSKSCLPGLPHSTILDGNQNLELYTHNLTAEIPQLLRQGLRPAPVLRAARKELRKDRLVAAQPGELPCQQHSLLEPWCQRH